MLNVFSLLYLKCYSVSRKWDCFVEEGLKEKVIMVPGNSFDIDPKNRRNLDVQPYSKFVRISYGPPMEDLIRGIASITRVVKKFGGNVKSS